jgi:hypothetical protein
MKAGFYTVLVTFTLCTASDLMAQHLDHPFTEEELYQLSRLFGSDADARAEARELMVPLGDTEDVKPIRKRSAPAPASPEMERLEREGWTRVEFKSVPSLQFTEDTLILLSLLSEELRDKVERYRRSRRGISGFLPEEVERWEKRRAELKEALDECRANPRPEPCFTPVDPPSRK